MITPMMPTQFARGSARGAQAQRRASVVTLADAVFAFGWDPLLRVKDERIINLNPGFVAANIPDNSAGAVSLKAGSSWNRRVQNLYTSGSDSLEAVLHLQGVALYVPDADFRGEAAALKEALDGGAYLNTTRDGKQHQFPLQGAVIESISQFEFKQATAADAERVIWSGSPFMFERPYRLDLKVDTLEVVYPAINWASGAIAAYAMLFGVLAPRELPGAGMIKDSNLPSTPYDLDYGGAPTALGPLSFADVASANASQRLARRRF